VRPTTTALVLSLILAAPAHAADVAGAKNVADALAQVRADQRPMLLGAGLTELHGWRYGDDLVPAFTALGRGLPNPQRRTMMLRELMIPLASLGCAPAVAESIRLVPTQQGEYVRARCPASAPLFPAARVAGASSELVMLAVVLEARAQKAGFAKETLHRRAVEALLGR
jgi:hypothetical protein